MPNKYSHGLVFSQQQYQRAFPNTHHPLSLGSPSTPKPITQTRSATSSIRAPSSHPVQTPVYSDYLRLEPDLESDSSHDFRTSTHTVQLIPSDAPRLDSRSSTRPRPRPPSDRLRIASSFASQLQNPHSPLPSFEPTLSHGQTLSSSLPDSTPSSPEPLHLGLDSPRDARNSRLYLHRKTSSVETQIYAPEPADSPSPPGARQKLPYVDTHEPYPSPPSPDERQYHFPIPPLQGRREASSRLPRLDVGHGISPTSTQERQHVFSMESPESSPPPISKGNRSGRLPSETQRSYLPSPPRDRRQIFLQEAQTIASPPHIQGRQVHSPFGTQDSPLFPSARQVQDYFSLEAHGSTSTPAQSGDRPNVSLKKTRSALPTPSHDSQSRPSLDMQRLQSPSQIKKQDDRGRPSLETQRSAPKREFQTSHEPIHGRRQSLDSQTTRSRLPLSKKTAQGRHLRPALSSQQLSLAQFIRESEQIHTSQASSSHRGKPDSRQNTLANAQRYSPKRTSFDQNPQTNRDQPSKLPDKFSSPHKKVIPSNQGAYDNVLIETHGLPLERPPSPPATPDSSKSFSLTSRADEPSKARSPPPIPKRSARRSPSRQRSSLRSSNSSVVHLPSEPTRPKTSSAADSSSISRKGSALHSPTFSIFPRRSSISATRSAQSVPFSDLSRTMTSTRPVSFSRSSQSKDKEHCEDTDLESLPSTLDFNVLPFEDPNIGPAIFRSTQLGRENPISPRYEAPNGGPGSIRTTQLGAENPCSDDRSVSSRASSFDSAAPPPIGFKRRISHVAADSIQPKTFKKESKLSILSFLRPTPATKTVLYSEATQGKPPVPVSGSKTTIASTSLLFAGYRSQLPLSQKTKDKAPKPQSQKSPGLATGKRPPRSTAHKDAAEKRRSWIKGDDVVDKYNIAGRTGKKGELERILSNL